MTCRVVDSNRVACFLNKLLSRMPPRRSSRAASASLETPVAQSAPVKRKRGQTVEPEAGEKENAVKPPSRTRRSSRSSAAPATRGRTASHNIASLPEVPESGHEEQSDSPPPKKARPSIDATGNEETAVEEEEKPKRGKRKAAGRESHRAGDMEVDEEAPSKASNRRTSARKASGSRPIDDAEDKAIETPSDSDEDEEVKPTRKGRKAKVSAPRKPPKKAVPPVPVDESDDDEVKPLPPPRSKSASAKIEENRKASGKAAAEHAEQEEEEEKSLFEPPPIPPPSRLPQTALEESSAPKARLVIHKLALINFKSYAGRQEIGPFHKVEYTVSF